MAKYSGTKIVACNFGLHWALSNTSRDINFIHLYRSCYIDRLKCDAWTRTRPVDNGVMAIRGSQCPPSPAREGPASDMYVGIYGWAQNSIL